MKSKLAPGKPIPEDISDLPNPYKGKKPKQVAKPKQKKRSKIDTVAFGGVVPYELDNND